ncbi:hypothetical protein [Novosphingobium sp. ZW T3_23]|uniref:hypothetical protein n=1 Tax=Novosphingobium sp. ZW T3_23 TaxID=3378084 RepID=UPI003853F868
MKGHALEGRNKPEDAYDIYYSARNYPGGIAALVEESAFEGYRKIAEKFRSFDDFGPYSMRRFVEGTDILEDRTAEEWQQDAFGQVITWLEALGGQDEAESVTEL